MVSKPLRLDWDVAEVRENVRRYVGFKTTTVGLGQETRMAKILIAVGFKTTTVGLGPPTSEFEKERERRFKTTTVGLGHV